MDIKKEASAGQESKGDILVKIAPQENGLDIAISSSLGKLFYREIAEAIESVANKYGIINAKISAIDDGALDFVVRARTEAAIIRASQEIEKKFYSDKSEVSYKPRRSRLYLPGNNPYLFQGISYYSADGIILDLEDAVPPEEKDTARMLVSYALKNLDFGKSEKMVRINPLDICGAEDIEAVIQNKPDILLIPKCESEYDVKKTVEQIEKFEKKYSINSHYVKIIPIIESAKGVNNAEDIALASDRIAALAFGAEDYTASLGVSKTKSEKELLYAKQVIVNAAKGAGIQASDTVYADIDDIEGLKTSTENSKMLGFDGRGAIHPSQIEIIHSVFNPDKKEIDKAKQIIDAFDNAKKEGLGVIKLNGKMIDMPVVLRAMRILRIAETTLEE